MVQDAVDLALMEGLHGHSLAAAMRLPKAEELEPSTPNV